MPARILPAFARPVAALTAAKRRAPLLSVVSHHALAYCDLQMACDLSDLLRESISQGCRNTYKCGFDSLTEFCSLSSSTSHKLSALPVDAITLCAWMMYKAQSIKVKSVVKYICGIRFAHILEGHEWSLSTHPLVQRTVRSLKMRYPTTSIMQKVPLSLSMLIKMCECMHGWPSFSKLSFDNLAWASASCIAFFACLRGGEFFIQPKATRPVLTGKAVSIRGLASERYVYIDVPSPKTRKDLISIPAIAASPSSGFVFDPVLLLEHYRARAALQGINVLGNQAAFKSKNGEPINRAFMIGRAETLRLAAKIEVLNTDGKPIKVSAASWRAGFVLSARQAGIVQENIRTNGRWTSVSGPLPYTVETLDVYQAMSKLLAINHSSSAEKGTGYAGAGGQFASCSLLL